VSDQTPVNTTRRTLRLTFGDYFEGPGLLVLELYEIFVILDNLVAFVLGRLE
jgi:hypothetical protein